jgi:glycosyltransferase involved in cell wall biosynthesis
VGRVRRAQGRSPRLSVVVPVFNVEQYLAECLDSILAQSFDDLEVVVVDDGSTDRSGQVAQGYVDRFPNVRLVTTANQGLGAARNTGVRQARGRLLAFADSDDVVLPDAYSTMVSALDESGSDFVVATFRRNFPDGTAVPPRQRMLHRERRLGITAEDHPQILTDVFAWNKVFRRDFWDRERLAFAEWVRYEDQPPLTRAYLTARSFDVIEQPVYLWRIRDDASSITQGKRRLEDLHDRFLTKRQALQTVRELGSPRVLHAFFVDGLVVDLPGYFRQIAGCEDEWWETLHRELRDLWADGPSFALTTIPVTHRLVAWLVVHDRRAEAETVMRFAEPYRPMELPVEDRGDAMVVKLPYWDDPSSGIPPELYRLHDRERRARLRSGGTPPDATATAP